MEQIMTRDDLMLVRSSDDVKRAKKEGKLGVFFHFQSSIPLEKKVDRLWYYKALGVGLIQFAYNTRSPYADGVTERTDSGLSNLGLDLVKASNRVGMIVDVSHTGEQSALEMIEASDEIVIMSHGNARGQIDNPRNVSDKLLKAIAENGGIVAVNYFPVYLDPDYEERREKMRTELRQDHPDLPEAAILARARSAAVPSYEIILDHIDYIAKVAGIEHVGLGSDFDGVPSLPEGMEDCTKLIKITEGLVRRGYTDEAIKKILGENFLRVMEAVIGS
jgi:membrane dipeptidase